MYRLASSTRAPEEFVSVQMPQHTPSPRGNLDDIDDLPISDPCFGSRKKKPSTFRQPSARKWVIHAIPVIVLLCLFILWWFSNQVNVEIKDGKIVAIYQIKMLRLNAIHSDLPAMPSSAQPSDLVPQKLISNNETGIHLISKTG